MPPRFQFAKRKAAELLKETKVKSAPVPLEKIAKHLNAEIHREPFSGELSGMVNREEDGSAVIGINSMHASTRQRFTLAHEIAHLVLHSEQEFHIDDRALVAFRDENSGLAVDDNEIEANQFAAALLMPEAFLREEEIDYSVPVEDMIRDLADKYEVSVQAMTIRLSSLKMLI